MTTLDFIPHTVNGIFRELEREAKITISLSRISGQSETTCNGQGYSVEKVNECQSPKEFYARLMSLCAGVRLAAMDSILSLDPSEKSALVMGCIHKAVRLIRCTTPVCSLPSDHNEKKEWGRITRQFITTRIVGPPSDLLKNEEKMDRFMDKVRAYALEWDKALNILMIQLISLLVLIEHQSDISPGIAHSQSPGSTSPCGEKIRFTGSVPKLAALARILAHRKLFEVNNKSRFFRQLVMVFSTTKQEEISWVSFRNHFDNPTPEELSFWDAELSEWRHIIRKLSVLN